MIGSFFFGYIYCDGGDNNDTSTNNTNQGANDKTISSVSSSTDKDGDYYVAKVSKDTVDNVASAIGHAIGTAISEGLPYLASGSAGAAAASAVIKSTSGMPLAPRALTTLVMSGAASAGTAIDIASSKALTQNSSVTSGNKVNTPSQDNRFMPESVNEELISPLEKLLALQLLSNLLILFLIVLIIFIIFNKFILKYNSEAFISLSTKYLPGKISTKLNKILTANLQLSNKFITIYLIVAILLIVLLVLLNIYVNSELVNNINDYVKVYHIIKNK